MAYANSFLDDEDEKKKQNEGVNTSGVVGGVADPGGSGAPEEPEKTPGTGFVNLQQYLDMNKGKGADLASKATQDVSKAADAYKTQAQSTIDQSKNKFEGAAGGDRATKVNAGIVQDADVNKQAAKDFLGAGYEGPKAVDYSAGLAADKGRLQSDLSKVDDPNQIQANLTKAYGQTGNYTSGYGLLDSFLLQGDESGRQKINEVKGRANEVGSTYDSAAKTLADQEKRARDQLAANQKSVVDTALQQKAKLENDANRKVAATNIAMSKNEREGAQKASIGDTLNQNQLADLQALSEIAGADGDYRKTFNAGSAPAPIDYGRTTNDEGFVFTPTGKRYDANGVEIPPEGGVAKNGAMPGGKPAPNIPVSTTGTWQAMPAPAKPTPPADDSGFVFTPTGKRYDANGVEIPSPVASPAKPAPPARGSSAEEKSKLKRRAGSN